MVNWSSFFHFHYHFADHDGQLTGHLHFLTRKLSAAAVTSLLISIVRQKRASYSNVLLRLPQFVTQKPDWRRLLTMGNESFGYENICLPEAVEFGLAPEDVEGSEGAGGAGGWGTEDVPATDELGAGPGMG